MVDDSRQLALARGVVGSVSRVEGSDRGVYRVGTVYRGSKCKRG